MNAAALVFGAGGSLGSAIQTSLRDQSFRVFTAGSKAKPQDPSHIHLTYEEALPAGLFDQLPALDAVVWAHGLNISDSITSFDPDSLQQLWQSNVMFIATSLASLLKSDRLTSGSRLVLVSSIWQLESRPGKFSYCITKAALQGLVKSCALDLGRRGILINAVLPGVVDTPMTRANLSPKQIAIITAQTALAHLPEPTDIAAAVAFLAAPTNRVITGQFLTVDAGFIGFKHI